MSTPTAQSTAPPQAQSIGLVLHQMGGFHVDKARTELQIPDGFEPIAMIAIGYPGAADSLPPELEARERAPRERKPLGSIVFGTRWGTALSAFE